jgi:hypothetical protein
MSEHAPDRIWSGIDIPKTIAGVLAAVSAAVVGSFLGVAGTLAGAAIASVVGSVGTELYHRWIDRGSKKIVATFVTAPAAVGTPAVAAAADETPSEPEPSSEHAPARRLRWGRMAAVAAGVFVLAIGTLTVFELISGKTAADATGHHTSSSTTLCSVFCGKSDKSDQGTTPATAPTSTAPTAPASTAPATSATDQPAQSAPATGTTTTAPTQTATPEPTATDTQNSGGDGQNNEAPPATAQPQGTE